MKLHFAPYLARCLPSSPNWQVCPFSGRCRKQFLHKIL